MIDINDRIEVHTTESVTTRTLKRAAKSGKVQFYRVRKNGTVRHIPFLPEGSPEREIAETVQALRDKGQTIAQISEAMDASPSTVRRHLERLHFTQAIEKAKRVEVETLLSHTIVEE
jgi:hypothetical protein